MLTFNGLGMDLGGLPTLSKAKTRSISAENPRGEMGGSGISTDGPAVHSARDLGRGWKVSPYVVVKPGETFSIADIEGPGAIQSMWLSGEVAR